MTPEPQPADLIAALAAALPPAHHGAVADIAALLSALSAGAPVPPAVQQRLRAEVGLGAALSELAERNAPLRLAGALIAFSHTHVAGNIHIRNVAAGHVFDVTVQLPLPPPALDEAFARLDVLPTDTLPPIAPLPSGSRVLFAPNPLFVGREVDLQQLAATLKTGTTTVIAATTGLGGIGKTQLAAEFVHRYGPFFAGGVCWLSFGDAAAVPAEVAACGHAMGLPAFDALAFADQVARVRQAWQEPLPRLLVFDNCEDEALLHQWRPTAGGCRVLVTSRRAVWDPTLGVATLPLGVLVRQESIALLRAFRPDLAADDADLDGLAAALGDLPLALHLAGSYLQVMQITPAAYLAELASEQLLAHESLQGVDLTVSPTNHALHVAKTFALSHDQLDPANPVDQVAQALLARAACFAPGELIPRALLVATVEVPDGAAKRRVQRAIRRLLAVGLLDAPDVQTLRLHRLLVAFITCGAGEARALAAVLQTVTEETHRCVNAGYPAALGPLLAHLHHLTAAVADAGDTVGADMLGAAGRARELLGAYGIARPLFEHALAIYEQVLGPDHPDTASSLNNLAHLLNAQGEYEAARPLFERALAIYEQVLGPDHPDTASSLNNLAALLAAQGKYATAHPLYERALAIREQVLGGIHLDTVLSLNNLAVLLYNQGDYAVARPLYARALAIREQVLGDTHPGTAQSLNNLAMLFYTQGNYDAARPLLERVLTIREQVLGDTHPDTAQSLNNLATLFYTQGNYDAARPFFERALTIHEQVLGNTHPDTATSLNNLAMLLDAQGDHATARPFFERALTICEQVLGATHPDTATSLNNLAAVLQVQGDYAAARPIYERALAIYEQVLGATHPDTARSLNNLAAVLQAQGDYVAARPLYERALAIREQVLGATHPDTARSLNHLAVLLYNQGDYAVARPHYERALAIQEQVLGATHPDTALSLNNLAALLKVQGDYAAARPLYERALAITEQVLGPQHPNTQIIRGNLVRLGQIITILHDADATIAKAHTPTDRLTLAMQFDTQAQDAEAGAITDWPEPTLAAQLRARAAQLRAEAATDASLDA